jgi:DNA-directed RNA polymerase subunit H (RpoH/RPB5)
MSSQYNDQIYRSRAVLLDILTMQGFQTEKYSQFGENEIHAMIANQELDMLLKHKEEQKQIFVHYFVQNTTLKIPTLNQLVDNFFEVTNQLDSKTDTLYIIVFDPPNEGMITHLKYIWEKENVNVIVQYIKNLMFNVLNHQLVPACRVVSEEKKREIKRIQNIATDAQFPEISRFDAMAKALLMRPGQVCEIIRPSETAITSLYYRICVNEGGIYKAISADTGGEGDD